MIRLDDIAEGEHDWRFSRGEEFAGAQGSLTAVPDRSTPWHASLRLAGDFGGGGVYVAAIKDLKDLDAKDVAAIRMRVKSENAKAIGVQMVDGTGQTHQQAWVPIVADGRWHELVLEPKRVAGGEHWGGANDGKWHAPASQLAISVSVKADEALKQPVVFLADIRAEALLPVFAHPAAFQDDFEESPTLPSRWAAEGGASISSTSAFHGLRSLLLKRSLAGIEQACSATSPAFDVAPGQCEIGLVCKSDLHSPDGSYNGLVDLECSDRAGKVVERITIAELFGKRDRQAVRKRVELPRNATSARFHARLNKTYGSFWVDDLSAVFLAPATRKDDRIARLLFSTSRLGNLLLPDDPRRVEITVETTKPLRDDQRTISCELRDYWGAEQMRPATSTLKRVGKKEGRFLYEASINLSGVPLEIGRYYEVHAAIPREGGEPFRNFTSLAILPEAATRRFKPDEIPFTSRNWDNRFPEYIRLTDRLGVRTCGIWGGWSSQPPYKPDAPGIELCRELGMGVLSGTPSATIEAGKKEYDERALREGARHFIEQYGNKARPLIISLGNEPHGTGDRVLANVAAYRVIYAEVKKVDPSIFVVATSVEPNEEYFRAGYGRWCDAYDFHVYEGAEDVRTAIESYRALIKKYGNDRPIWSTELGLNSQGLPRHAVAVELIKKFSTFFAAGGANASWFGLLYPDGDAKLYGSSGDAHNVFDCRFNRYCPRLDAIAYYNAVNSIAIKKFVAEKRYPGGVQGFLFVDRESHHLQVLWKGKGRQDAFIPLAGVEQVQVIRIDGSRRMLEADGKGITLSITEDPLLLLYDRGGNSLPDTLGTPSATLQSPPRTVARRGTNTMTVVSRDSSVDRVQLIAPPFWDVDRTPTTTTRGGEASVQFRITMPAASSVREADLTVTLDDTRGKRRGELYLRSPVGD